MKAREIARQYGFDQKLFESFVIKQSEVRVDEIIGNAKNDSDGL